MTKTKTLEPPAPEVAPLRPLAEIVAGIEGALGGIAAADVKFQRATLADRVWIGVLCLAAREHHAVPPAKRNPKGRNQHSKEATSHLRSGHQTDLSVVHPQGFLAWIGAAVSSVPQPTVYRYMAAARGLGLDAWSTEREARKLVAQRLREFDERQQPLTLAMLAAQGKEVGGGEGPSPKKPDLDAIKTDAVQTLFSFMDEVVNVKDALTPVEHDTVVNRLAEILRRLTGHEWSPVS